MDLATIIGLIAAFGLVTGAIISGGGAASFIHIQSLMITAGGTLFATLMSFNLKDMLGIAKVLKNAFFQNEKPLDELVTTMVKFATVARREGVLALEKELKKVDNEFISKGVQLAVDGTEEELTRTILETEMEYISERHSLGQKLFEKLAEYAPAFGMIGTLIGLIQMLRELDNPDALGPGMATALITTFYGSVMANMIFNPLASKLKIRAIREDLEKAVILEGVTSIQAGENPRLVQEKLQSFVPKAERGTSGKKAA
ncbi:MAG: motility protein A [Candidatus Zixiibacteriota bacterium]